MNTTEAANALIGSGLSVIPITMPGKKATVKWDIYQSRIPTVGEITYNGAIALVCGLVSGGLECLDIDVKYDLHKDDPEHSLVARLQDAIGDLFWKEIKEKLTIQETISGGYHLIYRCAEISGNMKLASRMPTPEELLAEPHDKGKVLLETRGEGGYFLVAPTPGYTVRIGNLEDIQTITPSQRQRLLDAARSLNEIWEERRAPSEKRLLTATEGISSWDDYNAKTEIPDILSHHGWKFVSSKGRQEFWKRPGTSDSLWSGSYHTELNLFYVYSTSCAPLDAGKAYTAYALTTFLDYNGNFEECARDLAKSGFGKFSRPETPSPPVQSHQNSLPSITYVEKSVVPKPVIAPGDVLRMTFKYQKKNLTPAILLNGTTLINFGEIFVIVGLPGQGKTAICEAICCSLLGTDAFGFQFNNNGKKALFIDTERHPDDVSDSYNNISKRLGAPKLDEDGELEGLVHLSVADFSKVEDLKFILERELATENYSLVVIDGIVDFSISMNDDKDATEVVKWIRMLAVKHNIALVTTIHPNKGSESIAGHLGAFLYRWARAILFARTSKQDKSIKELTGESEMAKLSHGSLTDLAPVYYAWDATVSLLMPTIFEPVADRGKADKIEAALNTVFKQNDRYRQSELITALMELGHSKTTAKRWLKHGVENGILNNNSAVYSRVHN